MSGMDRYYQVARCFRDEDLRADRQPEFTQLDIEVSFMDEDGLMGLMEEMIRVLFREVRGEELPDPLPRMTYAEAVRRFFADYILKNAKAADVIRLSLERLEINQRMRDRSRP